MSKIPVNNSLQNPSQDLSYHTRIPLMFRHIQIHNQHPQTIGYENQCNRSYQQNMRKYFVSNLYSNNIFNYFDVWNHIIHSVSKEKN